MLAQHVGTGIVTGITCIRSAWARALSTHHPTVDGIRCSAHPSTPLHVGVPPRLHLPQDALFRSRYVLSEPYSPSPRIHCLHWPNSVSSACRVDQLKQGTLSCKGGGWAPSWSQRGPTEVLYAMEGERQHGCFFSRCSCRGFSLRGRRHAAHEDGWCVVVSTAGSQAWC